MLFWKLRNSQRGEVEQLGDIREKTRKLFFPFKYDPLSPKSLMVAAVWDVLP